MHSMLRNKTTIFLMVFPGMILFVFAVFVAIILSGYYGTTDWNGMGKINFVGLRNFEDILLHDPIFWKSLLNALLLSLGLIFIQHPVAIVYAIIIDRIGGRCEKIFRAIFFIPCVISVVVTSQMWVSIYNPNFGLLNKFLALIHLDFLKQQWLGDPKVVLWSVLITLMWQGFGWAILYYYAGLKGLSNELYEAARIDGCNTVQTHLRITIPLLVPVIKVSVTLAVISALKQMETVFLMTDGGPGGASQFLANYLYIKAFDSYEYGYGNAISVLFVIVCIAATAGLNKIASRWDIYS